MRKSTLMVEKDLANENSVASVNKEVCVSFSQDSINDETTELMEPYLRRDDYNIKTARRVCGDIAGLCSWTRAMVIFHGINKEVLPLKVLAATVYYPFGRGP